MTPTIEVMIVFVNLVIFDCQKLFRTSNFWTIKIRDYPNIYYSECFVVLRAKGMMREVLRIYVLGDQDEIIITNPY